MITSVDASMHSRHSGPSNTLCETTLTLFGNAGGCTIQARQCCPLQSLIPISSRWACFGCGLMAGTLGLRLHQVHTPGQGFAANNALYKWWAPYTSLHVICRLTRFPMKDHLSML